MTEDIYEYIKERITARDAAELYGFEVDRHGKMCCPFHQDKNPSAKVDERFHCFACGIDGDAVDFTARLFNMPTLNAAKKLAADFGISLPDRKHKQKASAAKTALPVERRTREQIINAYADDVYDVYCGYYRIISKWLLDNSKSSDSVVRTYYFDIMDIQRRVEDLLDTLQYGTTEEKAQLIISTRGKVNRLERRIIEFTRRNMAGVHQ